MNPSLLPTFSSEDKEITIIQRKSTTFAIRTWPKAKFSHSLSLYFQIEEKHEKRLICITWDCIWDLQTRCFSECSGDHMISHFGLLARRNYESFLCFLLFLRKKDCGQCGGTVFPETAHKRCLLIRKNGGKIKWIVILKKGQFHVNSQP